MTIDEFAAATGLDGERLPEAFDALTEELRANRKTLAARSVDLAESLRRLNLDEDTVCGVVYLLAEERRCR